MTSETDELDRLARSVPDALGILSGLSARGVKFALGGSKYDWNDDFPVPLRLTLGLEQAEEMRRLTRSVRGHGGFAA